MLSLFPAKKKIRRDENLSHYVLCSVHHELAIVPLKDFPTPSCVACLCLLHDRATHFGSWAICCYCYWDG
ncbi:hypothetical protein V5799_020546 [Amblyomma americanum]|uniref:Uncharacterized protein n=1 Tax=Amblyomma americanum TaxID=6943 RepID=A0AAQ4ETK2_AMBAM